MSHPSHIREKAVVLRTRDRLSLNEIADKLGVSKTTAYYWIKSLPLTECESAAKCRVGLSKGAAENKRRWRVKREEWYRIGMATAPLELSNPSSRDFAVVYLCEGYRRSQHQIAVSNSNPSIIRLSMKWLALHSAKVPEFVLALHLDIDPSKAKAYWTRELGVDCSAIRVYPKCNSGKLSGRTNRCMNGVMSIRVTDVRTRCMLNAWMDYLQANHWA